MILLIRLAAEGVKCVPAIEFVVAQKLVYIAVQLVGAGLDDRIQDRAIAAAELGTVGVGLHLEFRNSIHGRLNDIGGLVQYIAQVRIVVYPIE